MNKNNILQWSVVIGLSILITTPLHIQHMPAAFLLGPMLAGIMCALKNINLTIPKSIFNLSQGVLGCLTAEAITLQVLFDLLSYWRLALIITIPTLLICIFIGFFLIRFSSLSTATSIWGVMPGGASAMIGICADYGADPRIVALIQYLRVIFVVFMLAVFSHFFAEHNISATLVKIEWFPMPTINLVYTLAIVVVGLFITQVIHFPSGRILIPMILGAFLQINGVVKLETPPWLLVFSFGAIGLSIGLRFNLAIIELAIKTLPVILLSILIMLIICYGQAILLHFYLGIDYLTSFLATSPGGLDTSVIIALDTRSDLAIILPLQLLRFSSVLLFGPTIARYLSRKIS